MTIHTNAPPTLPASTNRRTVALASADIRDGMGAGGGKPSQAADPGSWALTRGDG